MLCAGLASIVKYCMHVSEQWLKFVDESTPDQVAVSSCIMCIMGKFKIIALMAKQQKERSGQV